MQQIEVTFPGNIRPDTIKKVIEGNIQKNTNFQCTVTLLEEDNENSYLIETESSKAEIWYYIGMTASEIIRVYGE